MTAAAMGNLQTNWFVSAAVGVQLFHGHHGEWLFHHPVLDAAEVLVKDTHVC